MPSGRLFIPPEEIDEATTALSEHGFNLRWKCQPCRAQLPRCQANASLPWLEFGSGSPRGPLDRESLTLPTGLSSGCEVTAKSALALREGRRPFPHPVARKHTGECVECADLQRDWLPLLNVLTKSR